MVAVAVVAALLALGFAACGDDDDDRNAEKTASAPTGPATDGSGAAQGKCRRVDEPKPKRVKKQRAPKLELDPSKTYLATVETTCGDFEIELDAKNAPKTGGSFVSLARDGFYDGLTFHRIVTGFVIQGGDPRGDGTGGPGYSVTEPPPNDTVYSEGIVAMAKSQVDPPGGSGSQFFVVTSDDAALDPIYALLGKVTRGLDVVHRIEEVPAGPDERPVQPVVIKRIEIEVR